MGTPGFHPILYVNDPTAERDFVALFGFVTAYEGPEFPGFLALDHGDVRFGLSGNRGRASAGSSSSTTSRT